MTPSPYAYDIVRVLREKITMRAVAAHLGGAPILPFSQSDLTGGEPEAFGRRLDAPRWNANPESSWAA
jgi:hypothetical protein